MAAQPGVSSVNQEASQNLVDILVAQGSLNPAIAEKIKIAVVQSGKSEEEFVVDQKSVSEQALTKAKAVLYNTPYVDLDTIPTNPDALSFVTQDIATRFHVFPVTIDRNAKELTLAMSDPLDLSAIEFVEQKTGLRVKPVSSEPSKVESAATTRYVSSLSQEVTEAMSDVGQHKTKTLD